MKNIIFMILLCTILTSCSNYKELNEIGLITSLGIDIPQNQESGIRVTHQVINPSPLSNNTGNTSGLSLVNYTVEGDSLIDTYRKSSAIIPRESVVSHLSLVVISEEQAKKGIASLLDAFERGKQARSNIPVFIARGSTAEELLALIEPIESNPAKSIISTSENNKKMYGVAELVTMHEVITALSSEGRDVMLTGVSHSKKGKIENQTENLDKIDPTVIQVDGVALFKKDRLVQWLDGQVARTAQLIMSEAKSSTFPLPCDTNSEKNTKQITLITRGNKTKLSTEVKNGEIILQVNMSLRSEISESTCSSNLKDSKSLEKIEDLFVKEVASQIKQVFEVAQKHGADVFGFGEKLSKSNPTYWKQHKNNWNNLFSNATLSVNVKANIDNTGMRVNPFDFK